MHIDIPARMTPEKFREFAAYLVRLLRLDPELPELQRLNDYAEQLVRDRTADQCLIALMQDVYCVKHQPDGSIRIPERPIGYILDAWTVARRHVPHLDGLVDRIVADIHGTHLYVGSRLLAVIESGAINPRRDADSGNRYRIACEIIQQFSGLYVDWKGHIGITCSMTAIRSNSGWHFRFVTNVPASR